MATISFGIVPNIVQPPSCNVNTALSWSYRNPNGYMYLANLVFVGSTYPHITIGNCYRADAWAQAPTYGWGRGRIEFSRHPTITKAWLTKWPKVTDRQNILNNLFFHELGHILLNTWQQDISCPLSAKWKTVLVNRWGPSKVKYSTIYTEENVEQFSKPNAKTPWYYLLAKNHGVITDELMEQIANESQL